MSAASWLQVVALIVVLGATAYPLGIYMARVYGDDEKAPGDRFFRPIDNAIYRICRIDPKREQRWTVYAYSLIALQHLLVPRGVRVAAVPGPPSLQPHRRGREWSRISRSTPPSAS